MQQDKTVRAAKTGYIILSVLFLLFGISALFFHPFRYVKICSGLLMVLFGIIKMIGYFSKDLYCLTFQHDLSLGILFALLGILVLASRLESLVFLCLVCGIALTADAVFKIQTALVAKKFGIAPWWFILLLGIAAGAFGAVCAFRPSKSAETLSILLGASFFMDGILSLFLVLNTVKIIRNR